MTITHLEPTSGEIEIATDNAPSRLMEWARAAAEAHNLAGMLVTTAFVPKSFVDKKSRDQATNDVAAALLTGAEMGMSPMAALRAMDVIHGTPGFRAITLRGLAQAHGHSIVVLESTDHRAIVEGTRRGETTPQRSVWTMDRATKAGLPGKNPNWRSQPINMLLARATAEAVRLVASDVIMAMPYALEELDDDAPASEAKPPVKRTVSRKKAEPKPPPEPPEIDRAPSSEPATGPTDDPDPDVRSDAQSRHIFALLGDLDMNGDRDVVLEFLSSLLDRPVESTKTLTRDEATRVIDHLQRMAGQDTEAGR